MFASTESTGWYVLLEEYFLTISVRLGVLLEALVLSKNVISTVNTQTYYSCQAERKFLWTYGNIMRLLVFLSSSCLGPLHFLHIHLEDGVVSHCISRIELQEQNTLLLKEQLVEVVGQGSWGECPRALKTRPVI